MDSFDVQLSKIKKKKTLKNEAVLFIIATKLNCKLNI